MTNTTMVALENLKILVNLALVDGHMDEQEKSYIKNIGKAHRFPESSVETLFYSSHDLIVPQELTPDQKFDYVFTLIRLMKIDEKLFPNEIKFCGVIIEKLGYRKEVIAELIMKVTNESMTPAQIDQLKQSTAAYLIAG